MSFGFGLALSKTSPAEARLHRSETNPGFFQFGELLITAGKRRLINDFVIFRGPGDTACASGIEEVNMGIYDRNCTAPLHRAYAGDGEP